MTQLDREAAPIETADVRIWSAEWQAWWRPEALGYTDDPAQAGVWPLDEALRITSGVGPEKRLQLVPVLPCRRGAGGYAPGPYEGRCLQCGVTFYGDKRAISCARCAEANCNEEPLPDA